MGEGDHEDGDSAVDLFDPGFLACPHRTYRAILSGCPVQRATLTDTPLLSRYEDVLWALRSPEIFSSEMDGALSLGTERPMIPQQIDPPAQTRYRKLLDPYFSRRRVSALEPDLRRHARELIEGFASDGHCEFNTAFAVPYPCRAFLRILGLPVEHLDLFLELKDGIIRPQTLTDDASRVDGIRSETAQRIYRYFESVIEARTRSPRDDLVTHLISSDLDGEPPSREDVLDMCLLLLLAGLDTVTATLGCQVAHLAANPDRRRELVADPCRIPAAVEELLRWETPVMVIPRIATRDVDVGGAWIGEGELVMLLLGAANLDAGEFEAPDDVDFDRQKNRHLAFGAGPHRCLGSHLARLELRVALEELHAQIPDYAIEPGKAPRYSPGIREVRFLPLVWGR